MKKGNEKKNKIVRMTVSTKTIGSYGNLPEFLRNYYNCYDPLAATNECCVQCNHYVTGCSWSEHGEPVPGWLAKQTTKVVVRNNGKIQKNDSFKILYCPLFDKDTKL